MSAPPLDRYRELAQRLRDSVEAEATRRGDAPEATTHPPPTTATASRDAATDDDERSLAERALADMPTLSGPPWSPDLQPELLDTLELALFDKEPDVHLQALHDAGLLAVALPELAATVDFSQEAGRRHKDVWEHTQQVVKQAVRRPEVRWAAALHDIGKVHTREFCEGGSVTFHGHEALGARMFERMVAPRLGFSPALAQRVSFLIEHHLRPGQYESHWSDSAVRRMSRELGDHLRDALDLSRADITSKRKGRRRRCLFTISELQRRVLALREADAAPKPLPRGVGDAMIAAFGLPRGPAVGVLRRELERRVREGDLPAGADVSVYVEAMRPMAASLQAQTAR